ncbi:ATP-binding protein [Bacteroides nordii]|uniref:ATP-binding protein n=1 Tax=Bacteroides TaxID=816 RepID=UPI001C02D4AC|nr:MULTISPECIES: ATP-binding protein [Bacteroides]MBT9932323.1 AAA family ATPase [Bacteroides ovatus]MCE8464502.1 ATP-binding protein [Bacteroides nordii]UYU49867.1 ATP-binding protein [Bacteroides nordii]DAO14070.1 MAG TPA: AAA domain protein [Caudoviricetes sp.]
MRQYFKRHIDKYLEEWKNSANRKPLLVRGARQVGKSSAIRHLGESFKYYIEINLERQKDIKTLFGDNLNVKTICSQLSVIYNTPIVPGETLLFFDEIQESQRAISSLRYFYEDYPELHVIAAGSLLEFTLKELPSFGVGRIRSMYMYPFSFDEFLEAQGLSLQVNFKRNDADCEHPLPRPLHEDMISQLRSYYLVGGMPEAVRIWVQTGNYKECAIVHNDILDTYQDDFKKYKTRISPLLLAQTLKSVALQAGEKFVYAQVGNDIGGAMVKEALSLLSLAGLVTPVVHTAANGIPLGAEINEKFRKFLFLDIGLMQSMLKIQPKDILIADEVDFINRGGLSEMFAGLELMKYDSYLTKPELYYWQRTERGTQAEVDYVISRRGKIYPIEVKASNSGSMQSMYKFIELKKSDYGIRTSLEPFSSYKDIKVVPLYALSNKVVQGE